MKMRWILLFAVAVALVVVISTGDARSTRTRPDNVAAALKDLSEKPDPDVKSLAEMIQPVRQADAERLLGLMKSEYAHRDLELIIDEFRGLPHYSFDVFRPLGIYEERQQKIRNLSARMKTSVKPERLDDRDWISYQLLRSDFISSFADAGRFIEHEKRIRAFLPFEQTMYDARNALFDWADEKSKQAADKLAQAPDEAARALDKLRDANREDLSYLASRTDDAMRRTKNWYEVTADTVPGFKEKYEPLYSKANGALESYLTAVRARMQERPRERFGGGGGGGFFGRPMGKEGFEKILAIEDFVFTPSDDLYAFGEKYFTETLGELESLARAIDPAKTWREIIAETTAQHPKIGEIAPTYVTLQEAAGKFVEKAGLVTAPQKLFDDAITRRYVDEGGRIPFAFYRGEDEVDYMAVVAVSLKMNAAQQESKLRDHNYYSMFTVVSHEWFPGHHLQLSIAGTLQFPRAPFYSSFMVEGWAYYCEDMMDEAGFYEKENQPTGWNYDPRKIRFQRLKWQLLRAARLLIDVGYNAKGMKPEEAEKLLVDKVGLDPEDARAEVRRYLVTPTQPMSYLLGGVEIIKIRDGWKKAKGADFSLRAFHDELLSYGSIPPTLIRAAMLGERDAVQKEIDRAFAKYEK